MKSEDDLTPFEIETFFQRINRMLQAPKRLENLDATPTPGPWRVGSGGSCVVADTPVPEFGGSDSVDYYGGHLICESVAKRNAKLIAAAPDLLVACQAALNNMEHFRDASQMDMEIRQKLQEAIQKAIG